MKRGHVNKELKRRWIELRKDGTLNYYKVFFIPLFFW